MKYDHVNPAEAVLIHQDLNSRFSFGIHWGTFKLTLESYMEPKIKLLELVQSQPNLPTFAILDIGETTESLPMVSSINDVGNLYGGRGQKLVKIADG